MPISRYTIRVKPMRRAFPQNNRHLWAFLLVLGLGVGVQTQSQDADSDGRDFRLTDVSGQVVTGVLA